MRFKGDEIMGVYIKGFPLPNNCGACPLRLAWCRERIYMVTRPERCPLIPVPEHGDLIDRDKLEKDIDKYIGGEESRSRFHHWVQVQDAVIPMDNGGEK